MDTVISSQFNNPWLFSVVKRFFGLSLYHILLLSPIFAHTALADDNQLNLTDANSYALLPHLESLQPQADKVMSFKDVLDSQEFLPFPGGSIPVINQDIWYRFTLNNPAPEDSRWILDFAETLFDDIEFYYQQDGEWLSYRTGLLHDLSTRAINSLFVAFPLEAEAGSIKTFYFRIKTPHYPMIYPSLYAASDYATLITLHVGLSLVFIGILLGITLVITSTIIALKGNNGLLLFAFSIVAMLLIVAYINGIIYEFMPGAPGLHRALYPYLAVGANIFLLLFVRELFNLKNRRPALDRFLCLYLLAALFVPLIHIFDGFLSLPALSNMISFLTIFILFMMGFEAYMARLPSAFFYLIALLLYLLPTAYSIVGARGLLPYDIWGRHAYELGVLFLGVFISLSIRETLREKIKLKDESKNHNLVVDTRDKMKSEFLAAISHEIRTPINGVLGMAQLLHKTQQNETQKYYTDTIINSGQTLLTVINDILDLSKSDAGKLSLEVESVNLGGMIVNISNKFNSNLKGDAIRYHYAIDASVPNFVITDPVRLEQIVSNLLTNAAKFTEQGKIEFTVSLVSGEDDSKQAVVRFTVTDTGVGIPLRMQELIFDPYTQDRDSTIKNNPFHSTGLGLTICKRLVELMKGEIFLESAIGIGSKFWFDIPLTIDNPKQAMYRSDQWSLAGFHIGIVNMPRRHIENLSIHFRHYGINVTSLTTVEQAAVIDPPIDVLILFVLSRRQLQEDVEITAQCGKYKVIALLEPGLEEPSVDSIDGSLVTYLRVPAGVDLFFQALFDVLLIRGNPETSGAIDEASSPNDVKQSLNILVIEDNAVNQKVAQAMLESLGCSVLLANNGLQGLEMYKQHASTLHLVLMDCEMPIMDGFESTLNIRKYESETHLSKVPIIALTAHALPVNKELCLKSGMDSVLTKPIKLIHLEQAITSAIIL